MRLKPDEQNDHPEDGSTISLPSIVNGKPAAQDRPAHYPETIFGLHERGGEQLMLDAKRPGWVLELAAIGLDGTKTPADFNDLANAGLGVIVRINHGYGSSGTLPLPERYNDFAAACARYVQRSRGCHVWVIGNEPNHADERPDGRIIMPHEYARAYQLCRSAIRALKGHEADQVLVAGPAPWNATSTYAGNEKGDWVRYFIHILTMLDDGACDGFAIHTYTHDLDPRQISGNFLHTAMGYRHLRNEFRTYRDLMNAIPDRFRHLPVFITETDPTTEGKGWHPGQNVGWVRAAYKEIAEWNRDSAHQPIVALLLYRWPQVPDQPEWSISNRSGIIEDFKQALAAEPAADYQIRLPTAVEAAAVLEPGNLLPRKQRWRGLVASPLGLNLRSGPSTEHEILRVLPNETAVTVLAEVDDWLYVQALNRTGYLSRAFVQRELPDPVPVEPGDFLKDRPELLEVQLAPLTADQIAIDPDTAPWIDQAVAQTWNQSGALVTHLAQILEIDPNVAIAVLAMESGGRAFMGDGRMLIRFENHIFFEEWGKFEPDRFAQHFRYNLDTLWEDHQWRRSPDQEWRDFHGNQAAEWEVFTFARDQINANAAFRSISMGVPQIMGFNHEKVGYATAQALFDAFAASAHAQVIGFFDFVQAEPTRLDALRARDYMAFAASYNGPGQAPLYAALIQDAQKAFERLRTPTTPASSTSATNPATDPTTGPTAAPVVEPLPDEGNEGAVRLPVPPSAENLANLDPELYAAWRKHVLNGFEHNQVMFERLVNAFMGPYYTTVWLYRLTFAIGMAAFIASVVVSAYTGELLFGLLFGGLGVAAFLSFFVSRPLRALEENLNFITWLGVIYNTYWTRLLYAMNMATVQEDLSDMTDDFTRQMQELLDKSAAMNEKRPGLR